MYDRAARDIVSQVCRGKRQKSGDPGADVCDGSPLSGNIHSSYLG
jgi:hypothetical protein